MPRDLKLCHLHITFLERNKMSPVVNHSTPPSVPSHRSANCIRINYPPVLLRKATEFLRSPFCFANPNPPLFFLFKSVFMFPVFRD